MKRITFLLKATLLPVTLNSMMANKLLANEIPSLLDPKLTLKPDELTTDVFKGSFPPVKYGNTLEEVETTIQQVIERIFRDEDGMLRSGVNGSTMKPMQVNEVKDRPNGFGALTENSSIPRKSKPIWMNYENAGQASGNYLESLCIKARITGDAHVHELARKTVNAIITLWENAATMFHPYGGSGRGWYPKPYEGIKNVTGMFECSVDQYCDVTLGLHSYYLTLADAAEKKKIEEVILSFADWWYDHDYCGVYFGRAIYWKRLKGHSMGTGYFLYLNALAQSWHSSPKYKLGFETWLQLKEALQPGNKPTWLCMPGLTLNCLERLIVLKPDLNDFWLPAATYNADWLVRCINEDKAFLAHNSKNFAIGYLTTANRLVPDKGYGALAQRYMEQHTHREKFYTIKRGYQISEMHPIEAGDDYLNVFWCEGHVHWLVGYWNSRLHSSLKK